MPKFTNISGLWPPASPDELFEIYNTNCSHGWCHKLECFGDPYYTSQATQVEKIEREIKSILEEYEDGTLHSRDNSKWFETYMEEKDLIRLLPGVVPGFALRNRKWGESRDQLLGLCQRGLRLMIRLSST